nr:hypothetical protein [uncultured Kingella sp.]
MGETLFYNRKSGGYVTGEHSNLAAAGDDLAREWASLPVLSASLKTGNYTASRGQSAYKSKFNSSHHKPEEIETALKFARARYQQAEREGLTDSAAKTYAFSGIKKL